MMFFAVGFCISKSISGQQIQKRLVIGNLSGSIIFIIPDILCLSKIFACAVARLALLLPNPSIWPA